MAAVTALSIAPTVRDGIASGAAVVALESAVITHGLPKPAAIDAVRQQWDACQKKGATPAVVAVFDGQLRVGLTLDEVVALADRAGAVKVSPWNLAAATVSPGFGGTTVAATIVAAARSGIRVVTVAELASILTKHWELGGAGVVTSQPPPIDLAIPPAELAGDEATTARGPDRTPAELSRLQARLGDRVIRANVALLERNATLAAVVAQALRNHG